MTTVFMGGPRPNVWLRRIPYALCAGLFLWMDARVMAAAGGGDAARMTPPAGSGSR